MKKTIITLGALISVLFFSGCSKNTSAVTIPSNLVCKNFGKYDDKTCGVGEKDTYFIEATGDGSSFTHTVYNNSANTALQVAAEATLKKGHSYFAIVAPSKISNIQGNQMNTVKEFVDTCNIGMDDVLKVANDPCEMHRTGKGRKTYISIKTFREQPHDVITYNAQNVINDLKAKELYYQDAEIKISKRVKDI